ncbi:hypothetical protein [Kaistia sp. MMO-174]|uniref:hypothetical protein n=1 Tax=Kaistia sp. MMO-174 TaxID=3081256 RepID=UPI00301738DB
MAFDLKGLRRAVLGGTVGSGAGSQRSIYHYATNDDAATVETAGYFNGLASDLVVGDVIMASLDLDGTPVFKNYMVTANTGTVVTIAKQTTS